MINTKDLVKNVLNDIEDGIKNGINTGTIAKKYTLSSVHLQRLFKSAINLPLGTYIRSRKLKASIEDLYASNCKLIKIAMEYGFEHEQSYIKSFKREFGVTPGKLRRALNNA
jgi:AraC family transcriptional regulator